MRYEQVKPSKPIAHLVKSYWWVDSEGDTKVHQQKIVPDGYPELIAHYRDSYKVNISGEWERQGKLLLAGQIRNHFFLENTGASGMVGIKMQPAAIWHLFGINMSKLVDSVVDIEKLQIYTLKELMACVSSDFHQSIEAIEDWLAAFTLKNPIQHKAFDDVISKILQSNGTAKMSDLLEGIDTTDRHLERQFHKSVGLSPKFYSRIIRFTRIFDQIRQGRDKWSDISFETGYYDQAHFIKNFKEFTGESPSAYGFDEENMANFFLFNG